MPLSSPEGPYGKIFHGGVDEDDGDGEKVLHACDGQRLRERGWKRARHELVPLNLLSQGRLRGVRYRHSGGPRGSL